MNKKSTCKYHPTEPATSTCPECLYEICDICKSVDDFKLICSSCLRKKRRNKKLKYVTTIAIIAICISAFIFFKRNYEKPFDYGVNYFDIKKLEDYLSREPCDRDKIIVFLETLYKAGDYRRIIKETKSFEDKCGIYHRAYWLTFSAYKKLSQFDSAVVIVSKIIDNDKYDYDYWWWRGEAYELWGKYEKAIEDYKQSINLLPMINSIPFKLADLLEKVGRPCEAIFPIEQYAFLNPKFKNHIEVKKRLNTLYDGRCSELSGKGNAKIRFNPYHRIIKADVKINKKGKGRFIFDTGASYVVINESFAKKIGVYDQKSKLIFVQTAGGIKSAKLTKVNEINLKGLSAKYIDIAIMEDKDLGTEFDGLLGLSFLSRFNFKVDNQTNVIMLSQK